MRRVGHYRQPVATHAHRTQAGQLVPRNEADVRQPGADSVQYLGRVPDGVRSSRLRPTLRSSRLFRMLTAGLGHLVPGGCPAQAA